MDRFACDYLGVTKLAEEGLRDLSLQVVEAEQVVSVAFSFNAAFINVPHR